jgi:acyl-CoA thioester hydrolase
MPLTYNRNFRVRYYECDAYGHVNNGNYLRYMQETAFDASAAAGYDLKRYAEMGQHWIIRSTDIEYLQPLRYNDRIEVKTWIVDFRRASSRRAYEIRLSDSGELAAKATTDWVFLSTSTGKLVTIPRKLMEDFFPEGLPQSYPARSAFPTPPPSPAGVFTMQRKVAWHDIDSEQHVNNAVYFTYIEECGMQVIAAHCWPINRMMDEGFAILVRRQQIQNLETAKLDDELELATWASGVKRSTATRHYTIRRKSDNAMLARVNTLGVWVDLASGRPIRIPQNFLEDFAPNIVYDDR